MPSRIRPTKTILGIFEAMIERPTKSWYGLELARRASVGSATIYAALARLERASLVEADWEAVDPADVGRPRRRLYRLTREGADVAREVIPARAAPGPAALGVRRKWLPAPARRTT